MKNKKILLLLLLLFIGVLAGAYALYNRLGSGLSTQQLATQPPEAGTTAVTPPNASPTETAAQPDSTEGTSAPTLTVAPDFTVYDAEGNAVQLHNFFGKPIILNFWASWCGPCKMEMPDFHEKYLSLGGDIHFLMVNMTSGRETRASADAFLADAGYTFPVYYDTDGNAAYTYGAYSLPTTYFIDAQGHLIARAVGAIDAATLQKGIDMIF